MCPQRRHHVFDHHASYGAVTGSLSEISRAADELGLRACLCYEVSDREGESKCRAAIQENVDFIREPRAGATACAAA